MSLLRRALIVGLNDYPTAPLNGCVNDAHQVSAALERNANGTPNFSVKRIMDSAKRSELRSAINELFSGDSEIALFYFSGHGLINSVGGHIVTTDAESFDEGVSMDEILKIANASKAREKVIILDCCHSGSFASSSIGGSDNISYLSDGLTVLTASRKDEYAMEIRGSGVFTSLLVDGLMGGAADLRGNITPGSLYAYIDEALGAWEQRPIFKTNVSRFTSLRKVEPMVPLNTLRKTVNYFQNPEDEFKLDPSFEFTDKSAIEENVEIFKDLQKFVSVGLVVPVDEEHMYFAAMNSKSCKLTALGYQYWRLASEGKI